MVSICYVMIILMIFSYVRRTRSFTVFVSIVLLIILAATADVSFYSLISTSDPSRSNLAYAVRCIYHALLFSIFMLYVVYIIEVTSLEGRRKRLYIALSAGVLVAVVLLDVWQTFSGRAMSINGTSLEFQGRDTFIYGYLAFVAIILVLMFQVRNRLYRRVMLGFYATMAVSFIILAVQGIWGQSSFTVATFLFPVIAMFYIMHSNPYDVHLGAIDQKAMEDMVRYNYENKREFVFMSLYLKDFDEESKALPPEIQSIVRRFATDFFKDTMLAQISNGQMVMTFTKHHNPNYEARIVQILSAFRLQYQKYGFDYKIIIGESVDEISRKNEYVSFIRDIQRRIPDNTIHRVDASDVTTFKQMDHILAALDDISHSENLDDERVLVYCQPVFNVDTGRYDTAESLMRLQLPEIGLVFPDLFIPLAEENGYIHVLTKIILNKTCKAVQDMLKNGYSVSRVSVNVSPLELKDEHFCDDIMEIIDNSGVPGEKIAIELTESRNESDFILMKNKIAILKQKGIKFYLDDFGTGYSNMERIMELPFDIIKFDRSLVLASGSSERSRKIVSNLANMFTELDYSVLYEGVEDESDEQMCEHMSASYLQGYKYSRPVPIVKLKDYFDH